MTQCAGEQTHSHLFQHAQAQKPFGDTSTKSSGDNALDQFEDTVNPDLHKSEPFDDFALPPSVHGQLPGAPGPEVVAIQGGGKPISVGATTTKHEAKMHTTFASTTECILQNLTMGVGNPSARCYANAPWRAFTWTRALLQETNTQPWAIFKRPFKNPCSWLRRLTVDIQQLPGLKPLWKIHTCM